MESPQRRPLKNSAVLGGLAELENGSLRLVLEDVERAGEANIWQYRSSFTFKDYAPGELLDLASLLEVELANFGYSVLARRLASNGLGT
jgi:hypothetical protein